MEMKPILFNTGMVRAILDSHKTVTRRVVKPQPEGARSILDCDEEKRTFDLLCGNGGVGGVFVDWAETVKAPFWPHDILYVRETWTVWNGNYEYKADVDDGYGPFCSNCTLDICAGGCNSILKWHPSIHMPREAARIFLRVTDVRVERVQDIDDDGVVAEGLNIGDPFDELWDSTIKPADHALYGWDANPWVWVIEFERITREEALSHA